LPKVDLLTTASPMMSDAYKKLFPQQVIVTINNVFSARYLQPLKKLQHTALSLFWFSQHIGLYRGLEVFIKALNQLPDSDISLTILGNNRSKVYQQQLMKLSNKPQQILFREPVAPEDIFAVAAEYDIGLAGEMPNCLNKEICLSNKIFTYLLAGNAILASNMPGQRLFMKEYPGVGFTYEYENANDLAVKIKQLYNDRELLQNQKQQSTEYAVSTLNWEKEKVKWILLISKLLRN
jgi:glycosyltransferase involved in cell wall biosynthesis